MSELAPSTVSDPKANRPTSRGTPRLDSLTGLRFLAALVVFVGHAGSRLPADSVPEALRAVLAQGPVGVSFFFLLSGFVLTWSHRPGDPLSSFYRRRAARVLPAYWVALLTVVIVTIVLQSVPLAELLPASGISFLGLQSWVPVESVYFGGNQVGWSLSDELFFYAVFPLIVLLLRRRWSAWVMVGAAVAVIVGVAVAVHPLDRLSLDYWLLYINPVQRLAEFALGMVLAKVMRSGRRFPVPLWLALVLAVGGYVAASVVPPAFALVVTTLVPFWVLIGAAAQADLDRSWSPFRRTFLVKLGERSYAFYLIHSLVVVLTFAVAVRIPWAPFQTNALPASLTVVAVALAASVLAASALYSWVERPLEKRLRSAAPRPEMAAAER